MIATLVIIDTNVVVSALLTNDPSSPTAHILDCMVKGGFPFLLSSDLIGEYRRVLLRPRIRRRHRLGAEAVDDLLTELTFAATISEPSRASLMPPDPGDQHLWDLLVEHPRALLITGDQRLIDAAPPNPDDKAEGRGLSPRVFLQMLERAD